MPLSRSSRRVGRVEITREMIDDNLAQTVYAEIMPIEVRSDPMTGALEVFGWSDQFDELDGKYAIPLKHAPHYDVRFDRDNGGFKAVFTRNDMPPECPVTPEQAIARALLRVTRDLPMYFSKADLEARIRSYSWGEDLLQKNDLLPPHSTSDPENAGELSPGCAQRDDPIGSDLFDLATKEAIDVGRY